jgi:RimJ/RimL family protein N-acetyltransferase
MPNMQVTPVTLTGKIVRLEPLNKSHLADLLLEAQDESIWTYIPFIPPKSMADMEAMLSQALAAQTQGKEVPFAIIEQATNRAVGSTRYMNIAPHDYGLEIGWTWLGQNARRTGINTECKYLLLRHAFETLGAIRVQLKTDSRNERSQRAIERIGGVKEGILRNHVIMPDNYYRHSVYYSIIDSEWPAVKANLEAKMRPSV